jgi:hypothetical protein
MGEEQELESRPKHIAKNSHGWKERSNEKGVSCHGQDGILVVVAALLPTTYRIANARGYSKELPALEAMTEERKRRLKEAACVGL